MHDVAWVELHVSVEAPPLLIELGAALIETVGDGSLADGLTATPQAANSRDALKASALADCRQNSLDLLDSEPTDHKLNFIENPHAPVNAQRFRFRSLLFSAHNRTKYYLRWAFAYDRILLQDGR